LVAPSVAWHTAVSLLKINRLGASSLSLFGVVAVANETTLAGEPCLDQGRLEVLNTTYRLLD
jgi:hypothetical protein